MSNTYNRQEIDKDENVVTTQENGQFKQPQPPVVVCAPLAQEPINRIERLQDDAIFLSQNNKTKFFNVQSFNTSFLESKSKARENSSFAISKETLIEKNYENSPLYFKFSGCVAYCAQLNGCCIFYNRGINKEQMPILYSVQCQQEIFDEACKLYENSIPNYKFLFQLSFSAKLRDTFKRMGLSEDTLLLKVKNEAPSQRNKFMYNTAMLQLQMMRFDFIISPNITQYYVKQFLNTNTQPVVQPQYNEVCIQQPSTIANVQPIPIQTKKTTEKEDDTCIINATEFVINQNKDDIEDYDDTDASEDDDSSVSSAEFNDFDRVYNEPPTKQRKQITVLNLEGKKSDDINTQPLRLGQNDLHTINKGPASLASSSSSDRRGVPLSVASQGTSSVGFVMPARSETGVTEKFAKMGYSTEDNRINTFPSSYARGTNTNELNKTNIQTNTSLSTYAPSSTGITDNVADMNIEDEEYEDSGANDLARIAMLTREEMKILHRYKLDLARKRYTIFEDNNYTMRDEEGKLFFNPRLFPVIQMWNEPEYTQTFFDAFKDLHSDVPIFVTYMRYERGNKAKIALALADVMTDETNRLKQAVYLYLLSDLIELRDV
ncbi:hypothetical protein [Drosophila suzukii associated hytrosavirus 1]|nr:hypothetical protein [Drosophila suzukii associated hytrosavirus 1]